MKLTELHPRWVGAGSDGISDGHGNPVAERHGVGISFDCPCGYVSFANPLDGGPALKGKSPKWDRTGETFEDLTLRPSILRTVNPELPIALRGYTWYGFVTNGEIKTV